MCALCDLKCNQTPNEIHMEISIGIGIIFGRHSGIFQRSREKVNNRVQCINLNLFNLAHIFWCINYRTLIFGMHDPCDKPFQYAPCRDHATVSVSVMKDNRYSAVDPLG